MYSPHVTHLACVTGMVTQAGVPLGAQPDRNQSRVVAWQCVFSVKFSTFEPLNPIIQWMDTKKTQFWPQDMSGLILAQPKPMLVDCLPPNKFFCDRVVSRAMQWPVRRSCLWCRVANIKTPWPSKGSTKAPPTNVPKTCDASSSNAAFEESHGHQLCWHNHGRVSCILALVKATLQTRWDPL